MLIYTLPDERQLRAGQAFALNGIQYPSNWLALATPQDLADRGITAEEQPAPEPEPPTVEQLKQYAAAKRRDLANGSTVIDVGGSREIEVWTDAESRGAILGLVVATGMNPEITTQWKGADGGFHTLNPAEITALAMGMMSYVQICFAAESDVIADIQADPPAIVSIADIDDAFAHL
ncbi:DUF4376 domain-containing protein [Leptospira interrogans]